MADQKITALTELTTPAGEDLLAIVDDPAGTPVTNKVTLTNIKSLFNTVSDSGTTTVVYPQRLSHVSSGTVANSFGVGQEFELENASGTNEVASTIETYWTDSTDATEDAETLIKLIKAGTLTSAFKFSHSMNRLYSGTGATGFSLLAGGGTSAVAAANGEFDFIPNVSSDIGLRVISVGVYGTGDLFFQAKPGASGYGVFEGYGGLGTVIGSDGKVIIAPARTEYVRWDSNLMTFKDALDMAFNTTTGTKIGTATSQKLSFWNATPIVQPTTGVAESTFVENAGGTAVNVDSTFDGYTLQQISKALRNIGLLA